MKYDDETLMAYADGELDDARRADILAAIETDPDVSRRVEEFRVLRGRVSGAFGKVLNQPVPDALLKAARGAAAAAPSSVPSSGRVLQFPKRGARAASVPWSGREWIAMAASVLLGVALSWRFLSPAEDGVIVASHGALVARGSLAGALDRQLASNQRADDAVLIGLTFKNADGGYCRNFTLRASKTAGLACRVGDDWQIPVTTVATLPAGELQQAAAATPPVILQAIEARIVGDPLDAAGEDVARSSGWGARPK